MFNPKPQPKSRLQLEIEQLVFALGDHQPHSDEYGTIVDRIAKLTKVQEESKPESISKDTAVTVAANLVGIFMITKHEHLNVITSKALSFVLKPR